MALTKKVARPVQKGKSLKGKPVSKAEVRKRDYEEVYADGAVPLESKQDRDLNHAYGEAVSSKMFQERINRKMKVGKHTGPGHGKEPFCTCGTINPGAQYDIMLGMYVHTGIAPGVPGCFKPSRKYYEAAIEAGVVLAVHDKAKARKK